MFKLNTERLDEWLARVLDEQHDEIGFGLDWDPVMDDTYGAQVSQLVEYAQTEEVITSTNGEGRIMFALDYDTDGGSYLWLVDLTMDFNSPRLCSHYEEMRRLVIGGDREVIGVAAAQQILHEAVDTANGLLLGLTGHVNGTDPSPTVPTHYSESNPENNFRLSLAEGSLILNDPRIDAALAGALQDGFPLVVFFEPEREIFHATLLEPSVLRPEVNFKDLADANASTWGNDKRLLRAVRFALGSWWGGDEEMIALTTSTRVQAD